MKTKKITLIGLLIALAFVLSYVEFLLPLSIGIPGAKIGLANLAIMVALFLLGWQDALMLSIVRVILVGFTFGNMAMMMYSLAGAALSFAAMLIAKKQKVFYYRCQCHRWCVPQCWPDTCGNGCFRD
ncbi:Predicted membrane protein [Butyrivibrio fibrisolvens 16/4]|nr:Predicted membrane protein [Butyrivibrio fibrisolvens 16/4]